MAAHPLLSLALVSLLTQGGAIVNINKCCWKGESWDIDQVKCIAPGWQQLDETRLEKLEPPMDPKKVDWLPEILRSRPVLAHFDSEISGNHFAIIETDNDTVEEFLRVNSSAGVFAGLRHFVPPLETSAVYKQIFCVDRVTTGESHVIITGVFTRQLNKCCPMDKRLAADALSCEKLPEGRQAAWLPASPLANASGVRQRELPHFPWNVMVRTHEENDSIWRLVAPPDLANHRVWVRGKALRGGRLLEGVAWNYCFDETTVGEVVSSVVLAGVAAVTKCCGRGHRLSADNQRCEAFTAEEIAEAERLGRAPVPLEYTDQEGEDQKGEEELVGRLGEEKIEASMWIPQRLSTFLNASDGTVSVAYSTHVDLKTVTVLDSDEEGAWSLDFPSDSPSQMWLTRPARVGAAVRQLTEFYCFDAQADGGGGRRVLVVETPCQAPGVLCLPKCCPVGKLLKADGGCDVWPPSPGPPPRVWDPMKSIVTNYLPNNVTALAHFSFEDPCLGSDYVVHKLTPEDAARHLQERFEDSHYMQLFHCADMLLPEGEGEGEHEVFAYCVTPPVAPVYVHVRPLQLLAALLLIVGLAAILSEAETRHSVHGCALSCHAGCLLVSNTLQVIWFFTHNKGRRCELFAYFIYFFLVAAGVWLNVVSVNMAWGFRQPLGARAISQRGGRKLWRTFALWSVYGWGLPAVLTTFSVCMHINAESWSRDNYTVPSFFETRTCLGEDKLTADGKVYGNPGAVFYYYIPMTMLVVANAACLALTTSTIMAMKKETAVLQKMGTSTGAAGRGLQNARMYVKLLLSAGIMEIGLEIVAWAARNRAWSPNFSVHNSAVAWQVICIFNIVATFVDVGRALAVLWLSAGRCRWRWPWAWPGTWWRSVTTRATLMVGAWRARQRRQRSQNQAPTADGGGGDRRCSSDAASIDTTTTTDTSVATSTTGF